MDKYITTLDEETLQYAAQVLQEDCDKRDEEIIRIREWLATKPDLHAKNGEFYYKVTVLIQLIGYQYHTFTLFVLLGNLINTICGLCSCELH